MYVCLRRADRRSKNWSGGWGYILPTLVAIVLTDLSKNEGGGRAPDFPGSYGHSEVGLLAKTSIHLEALAKGLCRCNVSTECIYSRTLKNHHSEGQNRQLSWKIACRELNA
jgi:hypothetical protein